jgi:hypothetical protein
MWTCPKCQADVEDQFEICWSCGSNREGVTDPNFVREEDAAAAEGAPDRPDLVTVARFLTPGEAHLLRSRLEAEGIEAFVEGELTSTAWGADVLGGSEVQVAEKDLARAQQIYEIVGHHEPRPDDEEEAEGS